MPQIVILLVLNAFMTYCVYLKLCRIVASVPNLYIVKPAEVPTTPLSEAIADYRQARIEAAINYPAPDLDEKIDAFFLTQSARRSKVVK